VQPQLPLLSAVQALAFAHRPKQTEPKPQSGMPSVLVVNVGHGPLVLVVVVTVVEVQQKFTSAGASCTSFRLQTCRTLTLPLRVPSPSGFAHKTAASAAAERVVTSISMAAMRMVPPPV
jgi:hypothetical protein